MKKEIPNITAYLHAIYGIIIILLFTCSCSEPPDRNIQREQKSPDQKPLVIKKPVSSFNDTIIIDS
ncbi:MAG TPA: hypothetical protein VNV85_08520, partial [Puia sp.]|nr:hypothetical protein [Puia sp.]